MIGLNRPATMAATLVLVAALVVPAAAIAEEQVEQEVVAPESTEVVWKDEWKRMRWWEYAASTTLMAAGFTAQFILPPPDSGYEGGVLFDEPIYEAIRPETQRSWDRHALISDIGFYGSMVYRFADAIMIGIAHEAWDVSLQMAAMDFESFSLIASSLWVSQWAGLGRERPGFTTCGDADHVGEDCENDDIRYRSFYSGHPATAMSAAGSTCVHHYFLPLYGGGAADAIACGAMIGVAALTGVERAVTGKHWASDVLIGWGVGAAAGWLVPLSLHYGWERDTDQKSTTTLRLLPVMYGEHPGLAATGRF